MRARILLLLCAPLGACAEHLGHPPDNSPGPTLSSDDGGAGGGTTVDPGAPSDCPDQAKLVYVVDDRNILSSFKPDTLQFIDIGTLSCPAQIDPSTGVTATPFSMGIDRTPSAWVLYASGEVFHVDVSNAKCSPTSFVPGQHGFQLFGMGFASNASGSADETLFIGGGSQDANGNPGPSSLGSIDLGTLKVQSIAPIAGWPELTGTGDGNLWGFFPDVSNPQVGQIDKASGGLSSLYPLPTLAGMPHAWAFAFWGGDFWIFLERTSDRSTTVWHLRPNGQVTPALTNTGRHIVGAGVSTCAPIKIG
jgi:hypothetical protein